MLPGTKELWIKSMSDGLVFQMPEVCYGEVASLVAQHTRTPGMLNVLENPVLLRQLGNMGKQVLTEYCADIVSELNNPLRAVAAVDIPRLKKFSTEENFVYAAAAFVALFSMLDEVHRHPASGLPFMVHKATHSSALRMSEKNLEGITPNVKLGFHNDFCVNDRGAFLPQFIGLYNEFIGYRKAGSFSWVPAARWDEAIEFQHFYAISDPVDMSLSPAIYAHDNGYKTFGLSNLRVPLISCRADGTRHYFLNGKVADPERDRAHQEILDQMRSSLTRNRFRIGIAQKERRLIVVRNDQGFHARDIFEDPVPGLDLSRVFLRTVGNAGVQYP